MFILPGVAVEQFPVPFGLHKIGLQLPVHPQTSAGETLGQIVKEPAWPNKKLVDKQKTKIGISLFMRKLLE